MTDPFIPSAEERLARARADLRMGLPVVIRDGAEAALVLPAETGRPDRVTAMLALQPRAVLAITRWRAETLKARAYDGDVARVALPADADAGWIRAVADPSRDLAAPMKGPLATERSGPAHLHRLALGLLKSAQLLPAALVAGVARAPAGLSSLAAGDVAAGLEVPTRLHPVINARLPMSLAEAGRLHVFRPDDGGTEHYAVEVGRPDRDAAVLVRVHSACFTGDVLGSLKCDCGPQLHTALQRMNEAGAGVLLYLNQEGRGIGLVNKMRAYGLQDQGFDTVEANHRLGFEDDERDFRLGAGLLAQLGIGRVRLLTNNPRKIEILAANGIAVAERVPLVTPTNRFNAHYMEVKRDKSGHLP